MALSLRVAPSPKLGCLPDRSVQRDEHVVAAGVPVRTVSGRLGHASPSTTHNIYAHFIPASDRDAAATLDLLVAGDHDDLSP